MSIVHQYNINDIFLNHWHGRVTIHICLIIFWILILQCTKEYFPFMYFQFYCCNLFWCLKWCQSSGLGKNVICKSWRCIYISVLWSVYPGIRRDNKDAHNTQLVTIFSLSLHYFRNYSGNRCCPSFLVF